MPWRSKFLMSRRHPLAITTYVLTLTFGLLFTFHLMHTAALVGVSPWVDWMWRIELLLGGLFALTSVISEPRPDPKHPDLVDLLRIEGMAAGLGGLGWIIYAFSIASLVGTLSVPTLALGIMGVGMAVRSVTATVDAAKARTLGKVYDEAQTDPALREVLDRIKES